MQPHERKKWETPKFTPKAFFARMYRQDEKAAENWTSIVTRQVPPRPVIPLATSNQEQMQNEYIRAQLSVGNHYVIPCTQPVGADGGVRPGEAVDPFYFEVLNMQHGTSRTHTMHTVESADDLSLTAPLAVEIQPMTPMVAAGPDTAPSVDVVDVYDDGEPTWIQPLALAGFDAWNKRCKTFPTLMESDTAGCITLMDPVRAAIPYGVLDDRCPTLAIVHHNINKGWRPVDGKVTHTSTAIGAFDGAEAIKWKPHHQCLAIMDKVMPLTSSLPSRQLVNYYRLLLRGVPAEAGESNKTYTLALNQQKRKPVGLRRSCL